MDLMEFEQFLNEIMMPWSKARKENFARYKAMDKEERIQLLLSSLQSDYVPLIWKSAHMLLYEDREKYLPDAMRLLKNSDPSVRFAACAVANDNRILEAAQTLCEMALFDPHGRVRNVAIEALGRCGDRNSMAVLEQIRESDQGADELGYGFSSTAAEALASLKRRIGN